ncbi:hypothetical protein Q6U58_003743 [Vibrio cholerae]|nr:hypothetical protein [Vibrio cholerae]
MVKGNHQGQILRDHKKVGQKFIPPLMQLPNMKETSFRDNTLPCLIWLSAIFLRNPDRQSVHYVIEFLVKCKDILDGIENQAMLNFLRESLVHQHQLLENYPLDFLFEDYAYGVDKEEALEQLKEDVSALLDRYTMHSTKVQTTAFVSMTATGKLFLSSAIDLPDFNSIFTAPDSDESKRVASFVRANINAGAGFQDAEGGENEWSKSFWSQCFDMEACS